MTEIDDRIARMGFLEEIALKYEKMGRDLAESGKDYEPLVIFQGFEETYGLLHQRACAEYLHLNAYSKRKARLERKKNAQG